MGSDCIILRLLYRLLPDITLTNGLFNRRRPVDVQRQLVGNQSDGGLLEVDGREVPALHTGRAGGGGVRSGGGL